jgi:hypothetical protein
MGEPFQSQELMQRRNEDVWPLVLQENTRTDSDQKERRAQAAIQENDQNYGTALRVETLGDNLIYNRRKIRCRNIN